MKVKLRFQSLTWGGIQKHLTVRLILLLSDKAERYKRCIKHIINRLMLLLGRGVEVELLGADNSHDGVEDTELAGSESTNHEATGSKTSGAELDKANLASNVQEARSSRAGSTSALLVDLGEKSISRVGNDGGSDASNDTGGEGDGNVLAGSGLVGGSAEGLVDGLSSHALNGELGHGVGDLLEEDGTKTGVEAHDTISGEHASSASTEALGEGGVGNGADADGLQRAEEEVSDELGHGGRGKVDVGAVLPSLLLTHGVGEVDLEELNTTELEPALDKVASSRGTETLGMRKERRRLNPPVARIPTPSSATT